MPRPTPPARRPPQAGARQRRGTRCASRRDSIEPPGAPDLAAHALDVGDLSLDQVRLAAFARLVLELAEDERDSQVRQLPARDASTMHGGCAEQRVCQT